MKKIIKLDYIYLALFYSLAHAGIFLLHDSIYWDDWTLYKVDSSTIIETFEQAGALFNWAAYLHISMLSIGPWFYKFLTFVLMFLNGLFLYKIIEKSKCNDVFDLNNKKFEITLLFLVLPFYMARIYLIDLPYTVCYFLFFLGWRYKDTRLIALPAFFLSFNANSLLVFYVLPIAHMFFEIEGKFSYRKIVNFAKTKVDYLVLPFIFFFIKVFYFKPLGDYKGYNEQYSLFALAKTPVFQFIDFLNFEVNLFIAIFIASIFLYTRNGTIKQSSFATKNVLILGLTGLFVGLFPYWVLGHNPSFLDALSRHQLLMPFGISVIFIYILYRGMSNEIAWLGMAVIVGVSTAYSIEKYIDMSIDHQKQKQIIEFIKSDKNITENCLILFDDQSKELNGLSRNYRFYEWNGILKSATGREDNFGIESIDLDKFNTGFYNKFFQKKYLASNFKKTSNQCTVKVSITTMTETFLLSKIKIIAVPKDIISISSIRLI